MLSRTRLLVLASAIILPVSVAAQGDPTVAPPAKSVELIRAAKTVRVLFSGVRGPGMTTADVPVQATMSKLIAIAGLNEVTTNPDLVIQIDLETEAPAQTHNAQVMNAPIGTMQLVVSYTRARVFGSIQFRPAGVEPVFARFDGVANDLYSSRRAPQDAPFEEAFEGVFLPRLLQEMTRYFGRRILMGALALPDVTLRAGALRQLAEPAGKGDGDAMAAIMTALTDADDSVNRAAHGALVSMADAAVAPLLGRIKDPDPAVRTAVSRVLREIGGKAAIDTFIAALSDPVAEVRIDAVGTLSVLSYRTDLALLKPAVVPLIAILESDPDPRARKDAIDTLARMRDARALEPLIKVLDGRDRAMQDKAAQALTDLTSQRFGRNAKRWREWLAKQPRQ